MKNCPKNSPQMTSKMKNLPKKMKILKKMKNLKIFRQYTKKKLTRKFPPNDLKNEKLTSKMKILKKMENFENLQTI